MSYKEVLSYGTGNVFTSEMLLNKTAEGLQCAVNLNISLQRLRGAVLN